MKRTQRIIATFELLELAGGRGLTRDELLERLRERGHAVEIRQLERDLNDMRAKLDLPIASSDDVTDEQRAAGARVVYFVNRRAMERKSLLTSGQAIAWFESAGCGIWGRAIEEGLVMLHHERGTSTASVVRSFQATHAQSRALYLGQHRFIHFFLEVSPHLGFDLEVRIGRVSAESQKPLAPFPDDRVAVGLCGFQTMSRLFGPRGGHAAFYFPQNTANVIAVDLGGRMTCARPDLSTDGTPIVYASESVERTVIEECGQVCFGGALVYVAVPTSS